MGKTGFTAEQLASDQSVLDALSTAMMSFGMGKGLEKFEVPRKFALTFDEWTPDSGLVTAAMKLRRKQVMDKYAESIGNLYAQLNNNQSALLRHHGRGGKVSPI